MSIKALQPTPKRGTAELYRYAATFPCQCKHYCFVAKKLLSCRYRKKIPLPNRRHKWLQ